MRLLAQALHQRKSSSCMAQASPEESSAGCLHGSCMLCYIVILSYPGELYSSVFFVSKAWACPKDHIPDVFQAIGLDIPADAEDEADVTRSLFGCIRFPFSPFS